MSQAARTYTTAYLPDDDEGATRATLNLMCKLAKKGKRNPFVREQALHIISECQISSKDYRGEAECFFDWVRDNIRYTRDVDNIETLHGAHVLLETRQGDCDDMCILLASLLMSVGHKCRFVAVKVEGNPLFSHVYLQTLIGRSWLSMDATENCPIGWESETIVQKMYRYC